MRRRLLTTLVVIAALATAVAIAQLRDSPAPEVEMRTGSGCVVRTGSGEVTLTNEQMANAATIAAVGLVRNLPEQALVVALATAQQESRLVNVDYGDRDSLGLFQQRPSQGWGTPEQVMDPRYAANKFFDRLLRVPGWQEMRVTDAAQAVQRSAYPEAYEKWSESSRVLAEALVGRAAGAVNCALDRDPPEVGSAAVELLNTSIRRDWGKAAPVQDYNDVALTLRPADETHGWRLAHWIVAHSANTGVAAVRYGTYEWTGDRGGWQAIGTHNDRVIAEVASH